MTEENVKLKAQIVDLQSKSGFSGHNASEGRIRETFGGYDGVGAQSTIQARSSLDHENTLGRNKLASDGRRYSNDSIALPESAMSKNIGHSSNDISKNYEGGGSITNID